MTSLTIGSYINTSPRGATWKTFTATDENGKLVAECDRRGQLVRQLVSKGHTIATAPKEG